MTMPKHRHFTMPILHFGKDTTGSYPARTGRKRLFKIPRQQPASLAEIMSSNMDSQSSGSIQNSSGEAPSVRKLSTWHMRPDGSRAADRAPGMMTGPVGIAPSNAAFPAFSTQIGIGGANGGLLPPRVFDTGASPPPYLPVTSQRASRGLPAMLAEMGAADLANPDAPPSGGLPGLIQEYLRTR